MFCVLQGPFFGRFTSLIGYLSVPVFIWELYRSGAYRDALRLMVPLVPFALFVLTCIAVIPLIPYAAPRAKSVFTGSVLLFEIYLIARIQANTRILEYGFVAVIAGICALIVFDPGISARADQRLRLTASVLGDDADGLNASNISRYFGFAMFMASGLILRLRTKMVSIRFRWLQLLGLVSCIAMAAFVIIVYSGSRQGLIWVILVVGFLGVVFFRKNLGVAIVAACMLMVFGGVLFAVFGKETMMYERIFLVVNEDARQAQGEASFYGRMEMIKYALNMWTESPIWGHGNEAFRIDYGKYSHNNYTEILVNYGLIGFTFFYIPYGILIFALLPVLRRGDVLTKNEAAWVVACILAFLVSNLFIPAYYSRPSLAFVGLVMGRGWFLVSAYRASAGRHLPRRW